MTVIHTRCNLNRKREVPHTCYCYRANGVGIIKSTIITESFPLTIQLQFVSLFRHQHPLKIWGYPCLLQSTAIPNIIWAELKIIFKPFKSKTFHKAMSWCNTVWLYKRPVLESTILYILERSVFLNSFFVLSRLPSTWYDARWDYLQHLTLWGTTCNKKYP